MTAFIQDSTMLKGACVVVLGIMMLSFTFLFCYLVVVGQITTALELSGPLSIGIGGILNVLGVHLGNSMSTATTLAANQQANIAGGKP